MATPDDYAPDAIEALIDRARMNGNWLQVLRLIERLAHVFDVGAAVSSLQHPEPHNARAYYWVCMARVVFETRRDYANGIDCARRSLEIDPTCMDARVVICNIFLQIVGPFLLSYGAVDSENGGVGNCKEQKVDGEGSNESSISGSRFKITGDAKSYAEFEEWRERNKTPHERMHTARFKDLDCVDTIEFNPEVVLSDPLGAFRQTERDLILESINSFSKPRIKNALLAVLNSMSVQERVKVCNEMLALLKPLLTTRKADATHHLPPPPSSSSSSSSSSSPSSSSSSSSSAAENTSTGQVASGNEAQVEIFRPFHKKWLYMTIRTLLSPITLDGILTKYMSLCISEYRFLTLIDAVSTRGCIHELLGDTRKARADAQHVVQSILPQFVSSMSMIPPSCTNVALFAACRIPFLEINEGWIVESIESFNFCVGHSSHIRHLLPAPMLLGMTVEASIIAIYHAAVNSINRSINESIDTRDEDESVGDHIIRSNAAGSSRGNDSEWVSNDGSATKSLPPQSRNGDGSYNFQLDLLASFPARRPDAPSTSKKGPSLTSSGVSESLDKAFSLLLSAYQLMNSKAEPGKSLSSRVIEPMEQSLLRFLPDCKSDPRNVVHAASSKYISILLSAIQSSRVEGKGHSSPRNLEFLEWGLSLDLYSDTNLLWSLANEYIHSKRIDDGLELLSQCNVSMAEQLKVQRTIPRALFTPNAYPIPSPAATAYPSCKYVIITEGYTKTEVNEDWHHYKLYRAVLTWLSWGPMPEPSHPWLPACNLITAGLDMKAIDSRVLLNLTRQALNDLFEKLGEKIVSVVGSEEADNFPPGQDYFLPVNRIDSSGKTIKERFQVTKSCYHADMAFPRQTRDNSDTTKNVNQGLQTLVLLLGRAHAAVAREPHMYDFLRYRHLKAAAKAFSMIVNCVLSGDDEVAHSLSNAGDDDEHARCLYRLQGQAIVNYAVVLAEMGEISEAISVVNRTLKSLHIEAFQVKGQLLHLLALLLSCDNYDSYSLGTAAAMCLHSLSALSRDQAESASPNASTKTSHPTNEHSASAHRLETTQQKSNNAPSSFTSSHVKLTLALIEWSAGNRDSAIDLISECLKSERIAWSAMLDFSGDGDEGTHAQGGGKTMLGGKGHAIPNPNSNTSTDPTPKAQTPRGSSAHLATKQESHFYMSPSERRNFVELFVTAAGIYGQAGRYTEAKETLHIAWCCIFSLAGLSKETKDLLKNECHGVDDEGGVNSADGKRKRGKGVGGGGGSGGSGGGSSQASGSTPSASAAKPKKSDESRRIDLLRKVPMLLGWKLPTATGWGMVDEYLDGQAEILSAAAKILQDETEDICDPTAVDMYKLALMMYPECINALIALSIVEITRQRRQVEKGFEPTPNPTKIDEVASTTSPPVPSMYETINKHLSKIDISKSSASSSSFSTPPSPPPSPPSSPSMSNTPQSKSTSSSSSSHDRDAFLYTVANTAAPLQHASLAVKIQELNPKAWSALGRVLYELKMNQESADSFMTAIECEKYVALRPFSVVLK